MSNIVQKKWGYYMDLYELPANEGKASKVKELVIFPGKTLSMQKHFNRAEIWFVAQGTARVYSKNTEGLLEDWGVHNQHEQFFFEKEQWHMVENIGEDNLCIVEIQYGSECEEEDIERDLSYSK